MSIIAIANQHQTIEINDADKTVKMSIQNGDKKTVVILSPLEAAHMAYCLLDSAKSVSL